MSSKKTPLMIAAVFALGFAPAVSAGSMTSKAGPIQDVSVTPPPAMPAPRAQVDWTGPYAGAALGVGRASWSDSSTTGAIGNIFAGYKADMGDVVYGADLAYSPAWIGGFNANNESLRHGLTLLGSVGMKMGDEGRTLVSVSAGPSAVSVRDDQGTTRTSAGVSLGVGVEQLLENNVMLRTGLTYSRFSSVGASGERVNAVAGHVGAAFRF